MPFSQSGGSGATAPGAELVYNQITANANVVDTSEATATALITGSAFTFDGQPVIVEFFCAAILADSSLATDLVTVTLFEGSTEITRLGTVRTIVAANPNAQGCCFKFRFTPSAASHTYKICAFAGATTGTPTLTAGSGGTGGYAPAYLRITKV